MPESQSARPLPALRLGITGARNLQAQQLARIADELESVFTQIKPILQPAQSDSADILLITPLARGADRLAARVALANGFQIFVPMPFAQPEYEKDFIGVPRDSEHAIAISGAEELQEFRELLAQAVGKLELHGQRSDSGAAYEAVGRHVVQHCDLLIAIWNGQPGNGRGGTAEIVQFAVAQGRPVWWIHATEPRPARWLVGAHALQAAVEGTPPQSPPDVALKQWLLSRALHKS